MAVSVGGRGRRGLVAAEHKENRFSRNGTCT